MVNVYEVHTAAKCSWIKHLLNESNGKWKGHMWSRLNLEPNLINKNLSQKLIQAKTNFHQQVLVVGIVNTIHT